jgi:GT2 family glycosyltransferase
MYRLDILMTPTLSVIVPTRERAAYLPYCIRSCLESKNPNFEVLVIDNASEDGTPDVMREFHDERLRYHRNDLRLSMRDNFERGIEMSRGDILCFIGDDDGLLPRAVDQVLTLFSTLDVAAIAAARAHYFWPDLTTARRGMGLIPRSRSRFLLNSKCELRRLLKHTDYYRLPCLYHGFVKREVIRNVSARQDRFFLSSQVDMFSAIAISMEDIPYAYCGEPLVINGASRRSNGAAHFGGGDNQEKTLWKAEDDIGFLPGFEGSLTIGALLVESAVRYCNARGMPVDAIFDGPDVDEVLQIEWCRRRAKDPSTQPEELWRTAGRIQHLGTKAGPYRWDQVGRILNLCKRFATSMPMRLDAAGVGNVFESAMYMDRILEAHATGFLNSPVSQWSAAINLAKG